MPWVPLLDHIDRIVPEEEWFVLWSSAEEERQQRRRRVLPIGGDPPEVTKICMTALEVLLARPQAEWPRARAVDMHTGQILEPFDLRVLRGGGAYWVDSKFDVRLLIEIREEDEVSKEDVPSRPLTNAEQEVIVREFPPPARTGAPGAPPTTTMQLIELEFARRVGCGELPNDLWRRGALAELARDLRAWSQQHHSDRDAPTAKTITNKLLPAFREARGKRPKL